MFFLVLSLTQIIIGRQPFQHPQHHAGPQSVGIPPHDLANRLQRMGNQGKTIKLHRICYSFSINLKIDSYPLR